MTEEIRQMMSQIEIGIESEAFLKSNLYLYLSRLSKHVVESLVEELKVVNPLEHKKIIALQLQIGIAEKGIEWINDAIQRGLQSEHELRSLEGD